MIGPIPGTLIKHSPATIDHPAILDEIGGALQARGLASSERGQAARQAQAAARRQAATGHE
jgi:hypothetical protein